MPYSNELLVKYTAIIHLFWISYSETTDFSVEVGGGKNNLCSISKCSKFSFGFFSAKKQESGGECSLYE